MEQIQKTTNGSIDSQSDNKSFKEIAPLDNGKSNGIFNFSDGPNLEQLRRLQEKFSTDRNWSQFHTPRNLLLALVGEVGELSELFQWKGEVKEGCPDWSNDEKTHLGEEMADVLIYLIRLADVCHVDLPSVVQRKIRLNSIKYPVDQSYGSSKKYTAYSAPSVDHQ